MSCQSPCSECVAARRRYTLSRALDYNYIDHCTYAAVLHVHVRSRQLVAVARMAMERRLRRGARGGAWSHVLVSRENSRDGAPALTQYRPRQLAPRWHRRVSTAAALVDGQRSATHARRAERVGKTRLLKEIARHREGVVVCWGCCVVLFCFVSCCVVVLCR